MYVDDNLFLLFFLHIQLLEYLYALGKLSKPPEDFQHEAEVQLRPLQSYCLMCSHNLNTLTFVTTRQVDVITQTRQLQALSCLVKAAVLLPSAVEMGLTKSLDLDNVIEELRLGVKSLVVDMSHQQLEGITAWRKSRWRQMLDFLKLLLDNADTSLIGSKVINLQKLLLVSLTPEPQISEVKGHLEDPVTGEGLCEAFTATSLTLLQQDSVCVGDVTDCISGYIQLATDLDVLSPEVKTCLFQQVTIVVDRLKENDLHLLTGR